MAPAAGLLLPLLLLLAVGVLDPDHAAGLLAVAAAPTEGALAARGAGADQDIEDEDDAPLEVHIGGGEPTAAPVAGEAEIFVVGTVDGSVHGIDSEGQTIWSSDEVGGPTIKSFENRKGRRRAPHKVVPGDDGLLYLFSEDEGLALHHLSIPDLVSATPFTESLGEDERKVRVVGEKRTSFYELDPNTGERLRVFSSSDGNLLDGDWEAPAEDDKRTPRARRYVEKAPFEDAAPLLLGRVDYRVRAFDAASGEEMWNFTYGQFMSHQKDIERRSPTTLDRDLDGLDRPQRFTLAGMPVTVVFGAQRAEGPKAGWKFLTEQSIGRAGEGVIGDISKAKDVYLQRIRFEDGESQLYASTGVPGKPLMCSPEIFPDSDKAGDDYAIVPRPVAGGGGCDATWRPGELDEDFPLQGPYSVTNQIRVIGGRLGLPEPEPVSPGGEVAPVRVESSKDVRNLQMAVALLLVLLAYFVFESVSRRLTGRPARPPAMDQQQQQQQSSQGDDGGDEPVAREVRFDPVTNTERIGDLQVSLETILGRGCHGTTVLKGDLRGRPVAVKKVLSSQFKLAEKEIDLLIRSDEHPNIVRYYHTEVTRDFIFLALELCDSTLEQAVTTVREVNNKRKQSAGKSARKNLRIPEGSLRFLDSLASATKHLHDLCIVHCDIKPANILVVSTQDPSSAAEGGGDSMLVGLGDFFEAKLSDMGLGRKFAGTTSSIYGGTSMQGSGTIGWRAPELMRGLNTKKVLLDERDVAVRLGRKVDVFSLGCVFFYVISGGHHPFGEHLDRERNILDGTPINLGRIAHFPLAHDLISKMIRMDPCDRPSMHECLEHPLLWQSNVKLDFIKHVSDRLEADKSTDGERRKGLSVPETVLHEKFEERAEKVIGKQGWLQRLHPTLRQDVVESRRRYYATHSLRDLLRYMRNRLSHFRELDEPVRELLSPLPDGFLDQFLGSNRFPQLLLACYSFVLETCAHEPEFEAILGSRTVANHREASLAWQKSMQEDEKACPSSPVCERMRPASPPSQPIFRSRTVPQNGSGDQEDTPSPSGLGRSLTAPVPANVRPPPGFGAKPSSPMRREPTREQSPLRSISPGRRGTSPGGFGATLGSGLQQQQQQQQSSSPGGYGPVLSSSPGAFGSNLRSVIGDSPASAPVTNWRSSAPNEVAKKKSPFTSKPAGRDPVSGSPKIGTGRTLRPQRRYTGDPKKDPHYKTKACLNWEASKGTFCKMGDRCFYAHGAEELRSSSPAAASEGGDGVSIDR